MMWRADELERISDLREGVNLEAKEAQGRDGAGAIPKAIWATYSAFANTDGGWILLGVHEEDDGSLSALGISEPERLKKNFWNSVQNKEIISHNILSERDVSILTEDDRQVLVIYVPRAHRCDLPVFVGKDMFGGSYKRHADGDYHCSDHEVRQLIREASADPPSSRPLRGFSIDMLDMETVARYRRHLRDVQPGHVFLARDDEGLLSGLKALVTDRETGHKQLTLAGLLLFGTQEHIEDAIPSYFMDYQEHLNGEERWSDRICTDSSWSGNVYDFYMRVIRKLTQDLPVPFRLEGAQRIDDTPVHKAVREALANTLSHADYERGAAITIHRYRDRFVLENPGRLRVPLAELLQGGTSDPRNPIIHKAFMLLGITERAGSGIPQIMSAWDAQHWRRPTITESTERAERVSLLLHLSSTLPTAPAQRVETCLGAEWVSLSALQRTMLVRACDEANTSHEQLSQEIDAHARDITVELQRFVERGLLERIGHGRHCRYRFIGDLNKISSHHSEPSSHHSEPSSHHSEPSSHHSEPSSHLNVSDVLKRIAAPAQAKRRIKPEDMAMIIEGLCAQTPLSLSELALLLNRGETTVQNKYLPPLLQAGRIAYLYPDNPNHPKQKYTTPASPADEEE